MHRFYIAPEDWNPDSLVLGERKRITRAMCFGFKLVGGWLCSMVAAMKSRLKLRR